MRTDTKEREFARPNVMIDVVLLTLVDDALCVALPIRDREPFGGKPALVGGYVHVDEDVDLEAAVARILRAKAGVQGIYVEQLKTFGGLRRDPRGWSVVVTYLALVPYEVLAASDHNLNLVPVERAVGLPFDHDEIAAAAVSRLRGKGAYSTLPVMLLPPTFTIGEMHAIYEKVMGAPIDKSSFRRKVDDLRIVEEIEEKRLGTSKRPAQLFKLRGGETTFDRSLV